MLVLRLRVTATEESLLKESIAFQECGKRIIDFGLAAIRRFGRLAIREPFKFVVRVNAHCCCCFNGLINSLLPTVILNGCHVFPEGVSGSSLFTRVPYIQVNI